MEFSLHVFRLCLGVVGIRICSCVLSHAFEVIKAEYIYKEGYFMGTSLNIPQYFQYVLFQISFCFPGRY